MTEALEILKKYWKHTSFREPQDKIIKAVLEKKDVVALLPTGGGKSICFQIPALIQQGICLVISPLIALMEDQVENLNQKGIKAMRIPAGLSQDDEVILFDNLHYGNYKFLYLSPEKLKSKFIQDKIKQLHINTVAIDEAHCISEWGHDFRPSYRSINLIKELQPKANFIALTATATKKVIDDICTNLTLKNPLVFKKSFKRNNLAYQLFYTDDKLNKLLKILTKITAPSIVYVNSRNKTKDIANFIQNKGFTASYYHGGLNYVEKKLSFENWISEKTKIMVATNAFGMGIDKNNVKVVIHLDLPHSIENYIQEAGRAGRNDKKAFSVVLFNNNDIKSLEKKTIFQLPTINEIKDVYKNLFQFFQIPFGEHIETPFNFDLLKFCQKHHYTPNKITTILHILITNSILQLNNKYNKKSSIQFTTSSNFIINYTKEKSITNNIIQIILRNYPGVFEQQTPINEFWIAKKISSSSTKVIEVLNFLHHQEIIEYQKENSKTELFFLEPREDTITINRIAKNIQKHLQQKTNKAKELINFIQNNETCRSIQLLSYFDEKKLTKCGICDVCLQEKNNSIDLSEVILTQLKTNPEISFDKLCYLLNQPESIVLLNLQKLLAEELIGLNNKNNYYLI